MIHAAIIKAMVGNEQLKKKPLGDVTDINTGRDFLLVKTMRQSGKENYPNYNDSEWMEPSPLGNPDEVKAWLAALHDLNALRVIKPAEELKTELKRHLGLLPTEDTGFDPREFQPSFEEDGGGQVEVEEMKALAPAPKPVAKPAPVAVAPKPQDISQTQVLAEDDFLEQLKKMSG
jgi:hypothetical protein